MAPETDRRLLELGACWNSGDLCFVVEEWEDHYDEATARAKDYCRVCPKKVQYECMRHGLLFEKEPYGVWGGLSSRERRAIRRARREK